MIQQTLVVLKPDTIGRSIVGEIISRFERAGLHLVWLKMVNADKDLLEGHYEGIGKLGSRKGQKILDDVVLMMMKSPLIAMVREGVESVDYVRKLVGSTEPKSALPGTIRGDYAHISYGYVDTVADANLYNLIHASATLEEAEQEIQHRFAWNELFSHKPLNSAFTR